MHSFNRVLCSGLILGRLGKLLCCSYGIVRTANDHGHLVAARLLEDALQLPHSALHCGPRTQVHLTDDNEDGHLQGHGKSKMLPCRTSWKRRKKKKVRIKLGLVGRFHYITYT